MRAVKHVCDKWFNGLGPGRRFHEDYNTLHHSLQRPIGYLWHKI